MANASIRFFGRILLVFGLLELSLFTSVFTAPSQTLNLVILLPLTLGFGLLLPFFRVSTGFAPPYFTLTGLRAGAHGILGFLVTLGILAYLLIPFVDRFLWLKPFELPIVQIIQNPLFSSLLGLLVALFSASMIWRLFQNSGLIVKRQSQIALLGGLLILAILFWVMILPHGLSGMLHELTKLSGQS